MVRSSFFDIPYFVPSERFACAPPFSCKYFPINRICTKTMRFLCFSNPLLHSILGHISRRVASRYTLSSPSPLVFILKYSITEIVNPPIGRWYFYQYFCEEFDIWCLCKNNISILTRIIVFFSIIDERFRFRYNYSKITFPLIFPLFHFKFNWMYEEAK